MSFIKCIIGYNDFSRASSKHSSEKIGIATRRAKAYGFSWG